MCRGGVATGTIGCRTILTDVSGGAKIESGLGRVVAVVPARLQSTRLSRKMLRPLLGRPLLQWTVEAALRCSQFERVIVATDAEEIAALCEREGWAWQMTSAALASGTDRMCAVAGSVDADIYVNLQGDEPLVRPEHIDALLRPFAMGPRVEVTTVKVPCSPENIANPNAVKVVTGADGQALYFSRSSIPFDRDGAGTPCWKHLGLYAYRRRGAAAFCGAACGGA